MMTVLAPYPIFLMRKRFSMKIDEYFREWSKKEFADPKTCEIRNMKSSIISGRFWNLDFELLAGAPFQTGFRELASIAEKA